MSLMYAINFISIEVVHAIIMSNTRLRKIAFLSISNKELTKSRILSKNWLEFEARLKKLIRVAHKIGKALNEWYNMDMLKSIFVVVSAFESMEYFFLQNILNWPKI